jgi:hypothetical protein
MATKGKRQDVQRVPASVSVSEADERRAEELEGKARAQAKVQFQQLKDEAHAVFGMLEGRPGIISLKHLRDHLEKAGDELGNGHFILRFLGAERYLDVGTVAMLITIRQNLIAEIDRPSTADILLIDAAVVAYYNFLRTQKWIGDLCLVFESEAFGQSSLSDVHGPMVGMRLREELERLSEVILPLQDRCHRVLIRSLAQLEECQR